MNQYLSNGEKYRFGYQGDFAEDDTDETGFNHFELREYDARIGRWTTMDPKGQYWSPYNGNGNNPIRNIDPTGGENPVYDAQTGEFLGTDSKGMQGEALYMNREDFTQGMDHDMAYRMSFQYCDVADNVRAIVKPHYMNLWKRPDYDGYLTSAEAKEWYRTGNGQPLFVDASKIDISPLTTKSFEAKNPMYYNFITDGVGDYQTGRVYGTIKLTLQSWSSGKVILGGANGYLDTYNFEMHDGRHLRNLGTAYGKWRAGDGTDYDIFNYGKASVPMVFD